MPSKSIFRQPGVQHFQLVHRSQRDPLIHDPDASQHVLKPFERENVKKGKSRADLESILPDAELAHDRQANVGEAALYGIYYDDTKYDYLQHLRQVGVQEDGVESILIEAPSTSKQPGKQKPIKGTPVSLRDLPQGVLPSTSELPRTYESQQAVPESIAGLQPDMDPHLRQVLEALDDEAFFDDELEDDFFGELVEGGERNENEDIMFAFKEDGVEEDEDDEENDGEEDNGDEQEDWEARFARFQQAQKGAQNNGSDNGSEDGDTVGGLPEMSVIGGKGRRRRKGTSDASGYSMSSSSLYRNEALQTLDDRFDQIMLKEYNEEQESDSEENLTADSDNSDDVPELITRREDFGSMMDEFLNDYEILGRKLKPKLAGESAIEKLDTFRRAMGQDERVTHVLEDTDDEEKDDDDRLMMPFDVQDKTDRWDCETILTTFSNLENHPRLILARDPKPVSKILLDPRTGLPTVVGLDQLKSKSKPSSKYQGKIDSIEGEDNHDHGDDYKQRQLRSQTISRPRDEPKEAKKARKATVKAERQARRVDKKARKELFGTEFKAQVKAMANKESAVKKL